MYTVVSEMCGALLVPAILTDSNSQGRANVPDVLMRDMKH